MVRTLHFQCKGHGVQSLVRELGSYMPRSPTKKKNKNIYIYIYIERERERERIQFPLLYSRSLLFVYVFILKEHM